MNEWQINAAYGLDYSALIVLSLGVIVAIIWTWQTLDPSRSKNIRLAIVGLRILVLLTGFAMLLQLTLHLRKYKPSKARIAVLVDVSGSMAHGGKKSRLSRVDKLLKRAHGDLKWLESRHRVQWYRFADEAEIVSDSTRVTVPMEGSKKTDIKAAIDTVKKANSADPLDAILLISDGADTEQPLGTSNKQDLDWAAKLGVPVNTVFISTKSFDRDLAIEHVEVAPFAFSRSSTPITVTITNTGLDKTQVEAFLWNADSIMQRKAIQLSNGKGQCTFNVFPSKLGPQVFSITLPVSKNDEVPENNRAEVAFEVIRDKFRILHVVGNPSWDQRFLRETLKSWPRIDLVSFYILRTAYQSTTLGSSGMALIPFPTSEIFEEHLEEFDVVIFQGFDPASVGVDRYLDRIAAFVKDGGALVVISGSQGLGSDQISSNEFKSILPVKLLPPGTAISRFTDKTPFRLKLTEEGTSHPMLSIDPASEDSSALWHSLARLEGIARVARLQEGAYSLAVHPTVQADDGLAPVLAVKNVLKGRTLVMAVDSTWRWRFSGPMQGGSHDAYTRFWHRAIPWLTHSPEFDRLRINVSPSPVPVGTPAQVDIELSDAAYRPMPGTQIKGTITWFDKDGSKNEDTFESRLDEEGHYRMEWSPRMEGPHRIKIEAADGISLEQEFLAKTRNHERGHLKPIKHLLEAISESTGGHFEQDSISPRKLASSNKATREILTHSDKPLWDNPFSIILFIALLSAEWILRRKIGLG
jgi:uncharacterized membrane protein